MIVDLSIEYAFRFLKEKKFKDDIAERNIQIVLENVANHMNSSVLDHTRLVDAVKRHNPTVISLSFCYTEKSVLNPPEQKENIQKNSDLTD